MGIIVFVMRLERNLVKTVRTHDSNALNYQELGKYSGAPWAPFTTMSYFDHSVDK